MPEKKQGRAAPQQMTSRNALMAKMATAGDAVRPNVVPGELEAAGLLYVGDQVAHLVAAVTTLGQLHGSAAQAVAEELPKVGQAMVNATAAVVEQVAPAIRNGEGTVVGRQVQVAAALRADGTA